MLDKIRLATAEEVESIKDESDLTVTSAVYAFERPEGKSDLLVIRTAVEVDPIYFQPESNNARKTAFVWDAQNWLRKLGNQEFYFNVHVVDKTWIKAIEEWGGIRMSTEPEYRYKVKL